MQKLYLILDNPSIAEAAIDGGVDWIQFRHKGPYTSQALDAAKQVRLICKKRNIPFILNDRFDIALYLDADGVHVGQTDIPLSVIRTFWPKLVGATTPTLDTIEKAKQDGADYASIGHIFPTTTKVKTTPPLGLENLAPIAARSPLPLFAIGGIDLTNAASVLSLPIAGIAVSAAICSAADPKQAAQGMKDVFPR